MNIKNLIANVKNKVFSLYTGKTTASYVAIGATAVTGLAAAVVGSVALISVITNDTEQKTTAPTTTFVHTTEEETTLIPTTETTIIETTTPEPTTTETTTPETTTPEPTTTVVQTTTPPPTIAVEDLDIGSAEEEATAETTKKVQHEFYEEETEEPTTEKIETSTEAETEPETEAPVQEYACIAKGIDVSKWNSQGKSNPIDWTKVKESGVKFVIIRAGYRGQTTAKIFADPYFEEHIEGALAAGLQVGVYFYSQAITEDEALEEASFLLSVIDGYTLTYPVCFDWEPVSGSRARDAKLSKTEASNVARKFLSTVEGYGYEAMLYSYHSAIKDYFNTDLVNDYKVWMARYFNAYKENGVEYQVGDTLPETDYPYQMWQYTDTGTVPGIEGWVDMNVSFFSYTGSGVPNSAIVINLPATSYTINKGETVDYKTDVKAYNTAGMDASSSVTITIEDANGNIVTESNAFDTPGKYTITYTLKDFTGVSKSATATLTVRDNPTITLSSTTLSFSRKNTVYATILDAIKNNITSVKDYEGNDIDKSSVIITGVDAFYNPEAETETESKTEAPTTNKPSVEETTTTQDKETSTDETTSDDTTSDDTTSDDTTNDDTTNDETTSASSDETTSGESDESTEETSSDTLEDMSGETSETSSGESIASRMTIERWLVRASSQSPKYINGLALGTYTVTYKVTDSNGLETSVSITVIITD